MRRVVNRLDVTGVFAGGELPYGVVAQVSHRVGDAVLVKGLRFGHGAAAALAPQPGVGEFPLQALA